MKLDTISKQIEKIDDQPPFDQWHPTQCGKIDLCIDKNGDWLYDGSKFTRKQLIKLFARVLIKENDTFYLKTPAEQIEIQVEDAPFIITSWQYHNNQQAIVAETNLGHRIELNDTTELIEKTFNGESYLYLEVHRGLLAKVHRNVFYQWAEIGHEKQINQQSYLVITSNGFDLVLGKL